MSKSRKAYFCSSCGYESPKWTGKCPACDAWNSFTEEILHKGNESLPVAAWRGLHPTQTNTRSRSLAEVASHEVERILTFDPELNRVLGGGLVPGSLVLAAGEPGIGKSTLFLQDALRMPALTTLYICGEESSQQVKMRAQRLQLQHDRFYLLPETDTQAIFQEIARLQPQLVIVDSIQTLQSPLLDSAAGSIPQIRECTSEFQRFAKETHTPVILIGHITKDGTIAGPKLLEHMVDTVLQFEGDRHHAYRILRTTKNRFGSSSELAIYEMTGEGMQPVANPSDILIHHKEEPLSGIAIAAGMEGLRPLLMEVQALVTPSIYGTPQRTATGFDLRRLQLLLAVLEKRGGFHFGTRDVFVNIAGGLKIEDPSIDLAMVCALLSSYEDRPLDPNTCFAAEVGLSGEVRPVHRIEQRISEAEKLGFHQIVLSTYNRKATENLQTKIEITTTSTVEDLYRRLFP
ncbi:MAG: DNA repair protein RadA [Bacteroidetes bacterium]|nr:DNA repair protein RadA [Bacteroidota bacterium]